MDLGIAGKVAVVAASSKGLGFAVALELAREGAQVLISSRSQSHVDDALSRLRSELGGEAKVDGAAIDMNDPEGPAALVARAEQVFGPVDIAVGNNGGPPPGSPIGLTDDDWRSGLEQTFLSSQRLVEATVGGMQKRGFGRLLFIISTSVKQPIEGLVVSSAMRSAVVAYAKTLSDEVAADGVTVNCVAPGTIRTDRVESIVSSRAQADGVDKESIEASMRSKIPMGRFGDPAEFGSALAFLASARASYITGTVLQVDGGLVRHLS